MAGKRNRKMHEEATREYKKWKYRSHMLLLYAAAFLWIFPMVDPLLKLCVKRWKKYRAIAFTIRKSMLVGDHEYNAVQNK